MASLSVAGSTCQKPDTYAYLCHLQEMKQWMESLLKRSLPPVEELEERLRNGVLLVELGKLFLPGDSLWSRAYDMNESRYRERGLEFRHTDNTLIWLKSLEKLGLPPVFYPHVTDVYEKKNMPKLVYCLHALSHYLKKEGEIDTAVSDLYGEAQFSEKAVETAQATLETTADIPSIEVVEDLVEEELQYQGMDVLKANIERLRAQLGEEPLATSATVAAQQETPPSPIAKPTLTPRQQDIELIYDSADSARATASLNGKLDQPHSLSPPPSPSTIYGEVRCNKDGVTAVLYAKVDKEAVRKRKEQLAKEGLTPLEAVVRDINRSLDANDPVQTLKALQNDAANLPNVFNEPDRYHYSLLAERNLAMPENALVVYNGITRDDTERLLSNMSAGAYLIRCSSDTNHVFSFRNQTGIKHWKIDFKDGKYFLGSSAPYDCLAHLIEALLKNLRERTSLAVYPGVSAELRASSNLAVELSEVLKKLHLESGCELSHEQIRQVVLDTNEHIRAQMKAMMSSEPESTKQPESAKQPDNSAPPPPPAGGMSRVRPSMKRLVWNKAMILNLNRQQSEAYLKDIGRPGSYIVRPSESQVGDFSITFRTNSETRHWKVSHQNGGKLVIHPQPQMYDSLELVIQFFETTISAATGLRMIPLVPPTRKASVPQQQTPAQQSKSSPRMPPRRASSQGVAQWTVSDVAEWLHRVGLGEYAETFRVNEVDGQCLRSLDNEMLKNDLNVAALGNRQRILRKLQVLQN